ncbi:hypothetical protein AB6A40_000688 [Gnathostoma spinigerum]|uniref:Uncharacterized protein n=1 Tax=Gnathostoma spinigerum TaxID=75299 RepID=A0ABD6E2J9_9BILA
MEQSLLETRSPSANNKNKHQMTCCSCCSIMYGTMALGLLEIIIAALILVGVLNQIIVQRSSMNCQKVSMLQWFLPECLVEPPLDSHWITLFDYVIALLMTVILITIILMFFGVLQAVPLLLLPHIIVQVLCLTCSLIYFFLYAWTYLHDDLYKYHQPFQISSFVERMWLATLLLVLAAFQVHLLFVVIKCYIYLQMLRNERRKKMTKFEEVSKRVRVAKANGLWRSTSWGGGFQQYKGQYDGDNFWHHKKNKSKTISHVKWNLQKDVEESVLQTDEENFKHKKDAGSDVVAENSFSDQTKSRRGLFAECPWDILSTANISKPYARSSRESGPRQNYENVRKLTYPLIVKGRYELSPNSDGQGIKSPATAEFHQMRIRNDGPTMSQNLNFAVRSLKQRASPSLQGASTASFGYEDDGMCPFRGSTSVGPLVRRISISSTGPITILSSLSHNP